ncbi:MAG: hypothetical protein ACM3PS_06400 [Syntrophothermus sp.]
MYEFISKQNYKLRLDLEGTGITFHYITGQDRRGDIFQVSQSWPSIHALLAKLRQDQKYSSWDKSLLVWMQDQELCLRISTRDRKLQQECKFSPEETANIMEFLGRAPNLN